jgi:hypothetical protein
MRIIHMEYPGKSRSTTGAQSHQRNRPQIPKNPQRSPSQPVDGALQTNSSTFGTLLSSQGSSAPELDLATGRSGQPLKPTGSAATLQTEPRLHRLPRAPTRPNRTGRLEGVPGSPG